MVRGKLSSSEFRTADEWEGKITGEAGREVRLARLSLSSPESDSLSIRSEAPQPSSSQARPDLSESDRSERKGL